MDSVPLHIPLSVAPPFQCHRRPGHRRPGLGACSSGVFARRQCGRFRKASCSLGAERKLRTQSGIKVTLCVARCCESCCESKCQQMLKISCRWTTWWCSMCLCLRIGSQQNVGGNRKSSGRSRALLQTIYSNKKQIIDNMESAR